jgi:hypothetical protein
MLKRRLTQPEAHSADNPHALTEEFDRELEENSEVEGNLAGAPEIELEADPSETDLLTDSEDEGEAEEWPQAAPSHLRAKSWRWVLAGLTISCTAGGVAIAAFLWLMMLPPVPDCQKISSLSADRERLYCAQQAAQTGELPEVLDGLQLLESWTPEHPLYQEAQVWLQDWSQSVLTAAREKIAQSDLEGAVDLASRIPQTSPLYEEAQAEITDWQGQWAQGQVIYDKAQEALKQKDWELAEQQIVALAALDHRHWRAEQTAALSEQILAEKEAQANLTKAINLAEAETPENLNAAIAAIGQIDPKTYTWQEAQANFNQWSEKLLAVGLQHWQDGDLDQAIAFSKNIALNPTFAEPAQDLIWLSEARQAALASLSSWTASADHMLQLVKAMAIASQIQPESRFYPQAQSSLESWQAQLSDLTQLQVAQAVAAFKQPAALEFAIAQAQLIEADRPRRSQAQTLVAHWRQEIQRFEDRPYLLKARRLAEPGSISALKTAIAEASKIPQGRALRIEAQTLIFEWTQRIQTIEDQPILDRARSLAYEGRLSEAIAEADQIAQGRALYGEAQAAIDSWFYEIRQIELERERARRAAEAEAAARQAERESRRSDAAEDSPEESYEREGAAPPEAVDPEPWVEEPWVEEWSPSPAPAPPPAVESIPEPPAPPPPSDRYLGEPQGAVPESFELSQAWSGAIAPPEDFLPVTQLKA